MKVTNFTSNKGNKVPNQYLISIGNLEIFQSYNSIIAIKDGDKVRLNYVYWDWSRTTLKYLNQFLGTSGKKEILRNLKFSRGKWQTDHHIEDYFNVTLNTKDEIIAEAVKTGEIE